MIPSNPPPLGKYIANAFQPVAFGGGYFSIKMQRNITQSPYMRIVSTDAAYSQSIGVMRRINNTNAGSIFNLGGDGQVGHQPTGWYMFDPVVAPLEYLISSCSWYFGESRSASGILVDGGIYQNGLSFQINADDAGRWAHNDSSDGDYNDLIAIFSLIIPGQASWNISLDEQMIIVT